MINKLSFVRELGRVVLVVLGVSFLSFVILFTTAFLLEYFANYDISNPVICSQLGSPYLCIQKFGTTTMCPLYLQQGYSVNDMPAICINK